MFEHTTEAEARKQILDLVADYCDTFHKKKEYKEGDRIPYASRVYDHSEMVNLVDSSLEFWLTSGRYTDEFEKKLAEYLGVRYCSLVNSGSSANLIAFMALTSPLLGDRRVNRGDEVITVACGFPTTVAPMIQYGAVPVFVDVTIPQYNIDVNMLEEARSEKTKAVMIAHTLGNPFDLRAVKAFCDKYNLRARHRPALPQEHLRALFPRPGNQGAGQRAGAGHLEGVRRSARRHDLGRERNRPRQPLLDSAPGLKNYPPPASETVRSAANRRNSLLRLRHQPGSCLDVHSRRGRSVP